MSGADLDPRVHRGFNLLEKTLSTMKEFHDVENKEISLKGIESYYGEYMVANQMVKLGWTITRFGKTGVDITCEKKNRDPLTIEVKSSRMTPRFRGAKKGICWSVKNNQWARKEFQDLVCVAMELDKPKSILFSYQQALRNMAISTWTNDNSFNGKAQRHVRDLRLDYCKTFDDWTCNMELAKKRLGMKTKPTKFEIQLNKNPSSLFEKYDFFVSSEKLFG